VDGFGEAIGLSIVSKAVNIPCHPERNELASAVKDLTNSPGRGCEILRRLSNYLRLSRVSGDQARAFSSETPSGEQEEGGVGGTSGIGAESRSDVGSARTSEETDGEVAAGGEGLGDGASPHLGAVLLEGDVAHMVETVLDAPVPPSQREECLGVSVLGAQAGDVVAEVDIGGDDLLATDDEAVALDAADLAEMGPRCPMRARTADVRIQLRVSERPEHPDLSTPMAHLGGGVDEPTETPTPLGQLTLEPGWRYRHPGRQARRQALDPDPGGKALLRHRRAARVGCCRSGTGNRHGP